MKSTTKIFSFIFSSPIYFIGWIICAGAFVAIPTLIQIRYWDFPNRLTNVLFFGNMIIGTLAFFLGYYSGKNKD